MVLCLSVAGGVWAAEAWRSIDAHGNVEYSDTPRPGAVRIELPEPRTVPSRVPEASTELPTDAAVEESELPRNAVPYREITITDPGNEDTVRDNAGNLIVSVRLEPALQQRFGHRLRLLIDGAVYATGTVNNFAVTELDRGTHTLQAVVLGIDDAPLAVSDVVTFHLHRASVLQSERRSAAEQRPDGKP